MTSDITKSAHSPAPWRVEDIRNDYSGNTVARIGMLRIVTDSRNKDKDEADAALIAAAPELLAACRALISIEPCGDMDSIIENKVRPAISKAESPINDDCFPILP